MKIIFLFILICLTNIGRLFAQEDLVHWSFVSRKTADNVYQISIKANIKTGWHIYSQFPDEGPLPTIVHFARSPLISLQGKMRESGGFKKAYSETFNSVIRYYEHSMVLVQEIKVKGNIKTTLKGNINFMVCSDRECFRPVTKEFAVWLK